MSPFIKNFHFAATQGNFFVKHIEQIEHHLNNSLMLVTALAPVLGYDKASQIAHYASDHDLTLRDAALKLGFVSAEEFDRVVDPAKMVKPYVAAAS